MTKKIFWSVSVGIVVVLAIVVAIVLLNLGAIVKTGVNDYGPKITKTPVTVNDVSIGILTASVNIKNFVLGNPEGYKTPQAISVGKIGIGVNPFTVMSDKIVVRYVKIESPEITFEGGLGGNNLSKILDNINGTQQSGGVTVTNAAGKPKPSKKLQVDDLLISGAKVHASITGMGGKELTLPLPDIHLKDLGKGADGITAADLSKRVMQAITSATVEAVTSAVTNIGSDAKNLGKEGVNTIKKGIGSLFGK